MEELALTAPVTVSTTTSKYRVITVTFGMEMTMPPAEPGAVLIELKDNNDASSSYQYTGDTAIDMIKWLNTANLTVKSMQKRILERLSADGYLPGTVVGTPDPPA